MVFWGTNRWSVTIEHLLPRAKGGTNALENLVLAHRWCNNIASQLHTVEEKIERRERLRRRKRAWRPLATVKEAKRLKETLLD